MRFRPTARFPGIFHPLVLGLLIGLASGCTSGMAPSPGRWMDLSVDGGDSARVYVAGPAQSGAGIVMIHDWFGVTPFTTAAAEHLGALGYRVLAVDLYEGEVAQDHPTAGTLLGKMRQGRSDSIIHAAARLLRDEGTRRVGVIGFSAGGEQAFRAALAQDNAFDAAAIFYAGGFEGTSVDDLTTLRGPVLLVTGSADAWAMAPIHTLPERMDSAGRLLETYVYPGARHAFAQPLFNGGANLDTTATRLSWMLAEDFLGRHLLAD